jgi:hypothetical protein
LRLTIDTKEEDWAEVMNEPGVTMFDVIVHEKHGIQPKVDFGNSLENMAPFIDSEEDMIVPPAPRVVAGGWKKV